MLFGHGRKQLEIQNIRIGALTFRVVVMVRVRVSLGLE
jgi:hypothetical protein